MTHLDLNDFETGQELNSCPDWRVLAATRRDNGQAVRLTVFSAEISQYPEFRRAIKMDRAMLAMLQHQAIVKFLGDGESGGILYLWTEASDFTPLSEQLNEGRRFSSEDIIEIGWQVCSALQLAHNGGLSHGGLSASSVLLSDNLQVKVIDFGVARWLRAARNADASAGSGPALITISALASRADVERDLSDLAALLKQLLQTCNDDEEAVPGRVTTRSMVERLLARFEPSSIAGGPQRPVSAREFQGRLGEILIGTDDDSMPLVDQRNAPATSRRSIVVELFDPPEASLQVDGPVQRPAAFAWRKQILPIIVLVALVVVLCLIAGQLL